MKRVLGPPPRVWGRPSAYPSLLVAFTVHPHACGDDADRRDDLIRIVRSTPTRVGTTDDELSAITEFSSELITRIPQVGSA